MQCHGLQCGFCTPGMMITARALLDRNPDPTEDEIREAISGQICRCTGYTTIVRSIQWAAQACDRGGERMTTLESRPPSPDDTGRQRPEAVRPRPDAAQGGPAVHPRPRQLRRRRQPARHAAPGDPALAVRARPINSIDVTAAQAHPKVKAVVTGADLAEKGLAWMPTLSNDVQAVLATDKVRFQGQEVAFVVAEDRYSARDALELIDVDYEPLDPGHRRPHGARPVDAEVIRTDLDGKTDNHCFDWETGDAAATDAVFAKADVVVKQEIVYPRVHPAPMETCGAVADLDPVTGKLTLWSTTQAPHAHRTLYALVAGPARTQDPGHLARYRRRLRQQGADLSRLCLRDRRLAGAGQAGQVDGGPQREPDLHRLRPRLHHGRRDRRHQRRQDPGDPLQRAGRPRRVQRHCGAGEVPGRLLRGVHRQLRHRGRVLPHDRGVHQQGARRRRLRLLVPHHRGGVLRRAAGRLPGVRAEDGPGRAAAAEPVAARPVSVQVQDRLGVRLGRLRDHHAPGHGHDRLRRAARRAEREARARRADGHRHVVLHRGRRRRAAQGHGHPRPRHGRRLRAARAPDRQSRCAAVGSDPGPGPRDDVRPDRRRGAGHPARRHRRRARRHRPDPVRAGHLRQPVHAGVGCGRRAGGPQGPRQGQDHRLGHARGLGRRPGVGEGLVPRQGRPVGVGDHPGHRDARARRRRSARGHRGRPGRPDLLQPGEPHLSRTARTSASSTSTRAPRWSRCAASWPSTTAAPGSTR